VSFTATPQSPDLTYLRRKVDLFKAGDPHGVREMQTSLSVEAVTRRDGVRLLTRTKIEAFASACLPIEKDMRLHGGWDVVHTDRYLPNWGPECVTTDMPPTGARLAIGIDHGTGAGKQAAALIAIHQRDGWPHIWLLEEYRGDGFTTPEQDARGILDMLERRGLSYDDVDHWVGDRATGLDSREVRKSNKLMYVALARLLGRREDSPRMKRIEVPNKRPGSISAGYRLLNAVMGRRDETGMRHFRCAPHLKEFPDAARQWKGAAKDPLKDILDAVRYPVESVVEIGAWYPMRGYTS
jgi:hypothetical protein